MPNTGSAVSPREQRFRDLYRRITEIGTTLAEKTDARALLEELDKPGQPKPSGYESSHLPWLRNFVKHVCK